MSSSLPPPSSPFSYIFTPFKISFVKNPKVKDAKITPGLDLSFHNWFSNTAAHPRPTPFPFFQNFAINSAIRSRVAGMVVMDVTVAVGKVMYRSQPGTETLHPGKGCWRDSQSLAGLFYPPSSFPLPDPPLRKNKPPFCYCFHWCSLIWALL